MAEGARLESVYTGNRIVGSNPTPSATYAEFRYNTLLFTPVRERRRKWRFLAAPSLPQCPKAGGNFRALASVAMGPEAEIATSSIYGIS